MTAAPALPVHPLDLPEARSGLARQPGTFADHRRALLATAAARPALAGWRGRGPRDPGVMLLEFWAYVLDVVGFYDETLAHEAFVRTARRPESLRALVALLGATPRPAVAASVTLAAYADGTEPVLLRAGTAFRSAALPDGGPPQVFELDADTVIRPKWNGWTLAPCRPDRLPGAAGPTVLLDPKGVALTAGAPVLVAHPGGARALRVTALGHRTEADGVRYPTVTFDGDPGLPARTALADITLLRPTRTAGLWRGPRLGGDPAVISSSGGKTSLVLDGLHRDLHIGDRVIAGRGGDLYAFRIADVDEAPRSVRAATTTQFKDADGKVTGSVTSPATTVPVTVVTLDGALRTGISQSVSAVLSLAVRTAAPPVETVLHTGLTPAARITLPTATGIRADDALTVDGPVATTSTGPSAVLQPAQHPHAAVSALAAKGAPGAAASSARVADALRRLRRTLPAAPAAPALPGRFLLAPASGPGVDTTGRLDPATRTLTPDRDAAWTGELPAPVTAHGNLLPCTRGETVDHEVLGTGDATRPQQRFTLARSPVTHRATPTGARPDLDIRVNGRLWREVPTLYGLSGHEEVYLTRPGPDGRTDVVFGGPPRCAAPPTGSVITARYRVGAGAASPPARSITQIVRPVPGLAQVRNPVAATGGADAESDQDLRTRAPASALLLGRAVSLADMEAAAAGVPGAVGVRAGWRWSATRQRPVVRVAYIGPPELAPVLLRTLRALTDPTTPLEAAPAMPAPHRLALHLAPDPAEDPAAVAAAVRAALTAGPRAPLAPATLGVDGPLRRSALFAAVLAVPGTVAVQGATVDGAPFTAPALAPPDGGWLDLVDRLDVHAAAAR
ncbi:baseplate J/gp47 family protein [Streptomyces sp. NPDC006372]|uniref:baseplate J/gp47 family protein n=1 Tax=Streptomyces sp. NPDC006372 TaxID=3155599 RepID=UPI0033BBE896